MAIPVEAAAQLCCAVVLSTGCQLPRARGVCRMADDDREPQELLGGLPRRVPGVNGRTPGQIRRGYLPMPTADPADDADAASQPDTPRPIAAGQLPERTPGA